MIYFALHFCLDTDTVSKKPLNNDTINSDEDIVSNNLDMNIENIKDSI